jgi:hypothetical protein
MTNIFASFEGPVWFMLIPLAFIVCGLLGALATQIRKYVCYRHELDFKRDLVERGLSIDEIERVVAAKSSPDVK